MTATFLYVLLTLSADAGASPSVLPPEVNDATFRDGLRSRGLTAWLDQYLADVPPADVVDRMLREREAVLTQAAANPDSAKRTQQFVKASELLAKVVAASPKDPRALAWRLELARDEIERKAPEALDAVLLYDLPGRDRQRAARFTQSAKRELIALREALAATWRSLESMDEASVARLRASSSLHQLEEIDQQSNMLLAWVRLYELMTTTDASQVAERAGRLLDDVNSAGWIEPVAGQESRRCSALLLATICAREAGRFDDGDKYAREVIALVKSSAAAVGPQGRQASLIAVLEQVRLLRDRGQKSDAVAAAKQAADWAAHNRAGDTSVAMAMALLEGSVAAGSESPASAPAGAAATDIWVMLAPLAPLMEKGSDVRDAVYHTLVGAMADSPSASDSLVRMQLWAGAAVDAAGSHADGDETAPDLKRVCRVLQERLQRPVGPSAEIAVAGEAELAYLLGRAAWLQKDYATAVHAMCDVAKRWPKHDRAAIAAQSAAIVAQNWLAGAPVDQQSAARSAFIEASRIWRERSPSEPAVKTLQFYLASCLEQNQSWLEAAEEYAHVEAADPNHIRAVLGRARCLRRMIRPAQTSVKASEHAKPDENLRLAIAAAEQSLPTVKDPGTEPCLVAEAGVGLANLLNAPGVARPADALSALDSTSHGWQNCPAWKAIGLRERMESQRQLGRWQEARKTFEAYLRLQGDQTAAIGQALLESNRQAVLKDLDAGDATATRSSAAEGSQLAEVLMNVPVSAATQPAFSNPHQLRLTRAWLLLQADHAEDALAVYDACAGENQPTSSDQLACQVGRATCLCALGRAADALASFATLLNRLPEQSPLWWEVYAGTMRCHQLLKSDANEIVQSIKQRRRISPDLGGPRWRRALEQVEATVASK